MAAERGTRQKRATTSGDDERMRLLTGARVSRLVIRASLTTVRINPHSALAAQTVGARGERPEEFPLTTHILISTDRVRSPPPSSLACPFVPLLQSYSCRVLTRLAALAMLSLARGPRGPGLESLGARPDRFTQPRARLLSRPLATACEACTCSTPATEHAQSCSRPLSSLRRSPPALSPSRPRSPPNASSGTTSCVPQRRSSISESRCQSALTLSRPLAAPPAFLLARARALALSPDCLPTALQSRHRQRRPRTTARLQQVRGPSLALPVETASPLRSAAAGARSLAATLQSLGLLERKC